MSRFDSIKLIACDLDGTLLLNGAQRLQPETCKLIHRLRTEKGILFCAASGRQYANLRRLFEPIRDEIYYLCENGCLCYANDQRIYKETMDQNLARELIRDIMSTEGAEILISGENVHYLQPKDMSYYYHMRDVVRNDVTIVSDVLNIPEPYMKVSFYEKGGLHNVSRWQEKYAERCTVVPGQLEWLDMMPKGVNKASGLVHILNYLNIKPEECMAIGDNDNDREMLELTGIPAAVKSATPEIREITAIETDTVEHLFEKILSA